MFPKGNDAWAQKEVASCDARWTRFFAWKPTLMNCWNYQREREHWKMSLQVENEENNSHPRYMAYLFVKVLNQKKAWTLKNIFSSCEDVFDPSCVGISCKFELVSWETWCEDCILSWLFRIGDLPSKQKDSESKAMKTLYASWRFVWAQTCTKTTIQEVQLIHD